jgi:hypothetical protein
MNENNWRTVFFFQSFSSTVRRLNTLINKRPSCSRPLHIYFSISVEKVKKESKKGILAENIKGFSLVTDEQTDWFSKPCV